MSQRNSIKFKALILLMVFSLNTVVGFACAVGMDLGFNTKHHNEEKKQQQYSKKVTEHRHEDGTMHHHHGTDTPADHQENSATQPGDKNNCCNDNVIKFEQLDKSIANAVKVNFSSPAVVAIIHTFYLNYQPSASKIINGKSIDRRCFLPPPDIRVSIQSFQI